MRPPLTSLVRGLGLAVGSGKLLSYFTSPSERASCSQPSTRRPAPCSGHKPAPRPPPGSPPSPRSLGPHCRLTTCTAPSGADSACLCCWRVPAVEVTALPAVGSRWTAWATTAQLAPAAAPRAGVRRGRWGRVARASRPPTAWSTRRAGGRRQEGPTSGKARHNTLSKVSPSQLWTRHTSHGKANNFGMRALLAANRRSLLSFYPYFGVGDAFWNLRLQHQQARPTLFV